MVYPTSWDVRTTDYWVHQLDAAQNIVKSWNILSDPTLPSIPASAPYRVDVRFHNYGSSAVRIRLAAQSIGHQSGNQGQVIYTDYSPDLLPGEEFLHYHWLQMWAEPVDLRLWVDNAYTGNPIGSGNAPPGTPPPWPANIAQGELFDMALRSRHITAIQLGAGPGQDAIVINVTDNQGYALPGVSIGGDLTGTTDANGNAQFTVRPGAHNVNLSKSGYNPGGGSINVTFSGQTFKFQLSPSTPPVTPPPIIIHDTITINVTDATGKPMQGVDAEVT